jgi:AraC-like DNA-binding protein
MDRDELAARYFAAWNNRDVSGLLKLMHPQASYHDAFWGETCSGKDLSKYFGANFGADTRWYRLKDEIIFTQNGLIFRYEAFDVNDHDGLAPIHCGAEILTITDGLIMTISDHYCDPDPVELIQVAKHADELHRHVHIATLGLSAKTSGRIQRRLAELVSGVSILLDPAVTVTQLADYIGCSVMHLFHVLEEEKGTTFIQYVSECRARYATTLLVNASNGTVDLREVAQQSGFESVEKLNDAFQSTLNICSIIGCRSYDAALRSIRKFCNRSRSAASSFSQFCIATTIRGSVTNSAYCA